MPQDKSKILLLTVVALLLGILVAYVWTGESPSKPATVQEALSEDLIDQQPLRAARALLSVANTADEQQLALQAIRIADDEVDLAFAGALLEAQQEPQRQSAESKAVRARIQSLQAKVQSDQEEIRRLEGLAANVKSSNDDAIQEQLEVSKAQLDLDQEGLRDANQDLIRAGGNPVARVQELLNEHEAVEHGNSNSPGPQIKPATFRVSGITLASHVEDWWQLRGKQKKLTEARAGATSAIASLTGTKDSHQQASSGTPPRESAPGTLQPESPTNPSQAVADLRARAQGEKIPAVYDKRILDLQALDRLYGSWLEIAASQVRVVGHAVLGSVLLILAIIFGVSVALRSIDRLYADRGSQNRRLLSTKIAYRSTMQAIAVVLVLLALFGIPNQISTVLALAGAGLTVALKDFIVGFFGWFTLMGRNGIRVGDWVEINGIGGQVVEIGLLQTVLLETGNWNDAGHPTGRKVTFVNSFAIEGHYFNFTTSGQWMWDEIDVLIPPGDNPHTVTEAIRKIVEDETAAYASSAEKEWRWATHDGASQSFSAAPAVDLRPTSTGMNLFVRYITQANSRHELRNRLYQAIVVILYGNGPSQATQSTSERKM